MIADAYWLKARRVKAEIVPQYVLPDDTQSTDIYQLAQSTTVRIVRAESSGSGAIVKKQGKVYTVLTNWHVVSTDNAPSLITVDGKTHESIKPPQQLGDVDLALIQFSSKANYQTADISKKTPRIGEKVYAAGFPLYHQDSSEDTLALGIKAFRLTQGEISLIPSKSFPQGYRLGYTNDIEMGMSGGPIFNERGLLIGVNGRRKHGDPDFGVYVFEDGSEPPSTMLEQMVNSSWGIPITTYIKLVSN